MEASTRLAANLGLDSIELSTCIPSYQNEMLNDGAFSRIADRYGIFYTIHMGELFDPYTFNKNSRKAFRNTYVFSKILHIPVSTLHLSKGVYSTLPDREVFLHQNYYEDYMTRAKESLVFVASTMGFEHAFVYFESTVVFFSFQMDSVELLLQCLALGLTYDTGHVTVMNTRTEIF